MPPALRADAARWRRRPARPAPALLAPLTLALLGILAPGVVSGRRDEDDTPNEGNNTLRFVDARSQGRRHANRISPIDRLVHQPVYARRGALQNVKDVDEFEEFDDPPDMKFSKISRSQAERASPEDEKGWELETGTRKKNALRITAVTWNAGNKKEEDDVETWSVFLKEVLRKVATDTDLLVIGLQELRGEPVYASLLAHLHQFLTSKKGGKLWWHYLPTKSRNFRNPFCSDKFWTGLFAIGLSSAWKFEGLRQSEPVSSKLDCKAKRGWGCNTRSDLLECGKAENFLFLRATHQTNVLYPPININLINAHVSFSKDPEERLARINQAMELSYRQSKTDLVIFVADFNSRFVFPVEDGGKPLMEAETTEQIADRMRGGGLASPGGRYYSQQSRADELSYYTAHLANGGGGGPMRWFEPSPPRFPPSYKLQPDGGYVDDSEAKHRPAYTDRVLIWKAPSMHTWTVAYDRVFLGADGGRRNGELRDPFRRRPYLSDHDAVFATIDVRR